MSEGQAAPRRLVVFGVTGQLGQELVERLDESGWPIAELVGVASGDSVGTTFSFRGDDLDVQGEWPVLKGRDLVFLCTRGAPALEIVRECLRAEVACLDLTGALSGQGEVPMPFGVGEALAADEIASAPLLASPSGTALTWAAVLGALQGAGHVERVVGTVLSSASALGRAGLVALSEESIALFNQSTAPEPGPAGQTVAFDVVPAAGVEVDRVRQELGRAFGADLAVDLAALQIPAFVGEGSVVTVEFEGPVTREEIEAKLEASSVLTRVSEGFGSRGLEAVDDTGLAPSGPTLRDAAGSEGVLVGSLEPDRSFAEGRGWRLWIVSDPLRVVAEQAVRLAGRRLGLE